jgi:hypothetical protein
MALLSDHLVVRGSLGPMVRTAPTAGGVRSAVMHGLGVLRAVSSAAFCASATPELDAAGVLRTTVAQAIRRS